MTTMKAGFILATLATILAGCASDDECKRGDDSEYRSHERIETRTYDDGKNVR